MQVLEHIKLKNKLENVINTLAAKSLDLTVYKYKN